MDDTMTYGESAQGVQITFRRALQELADHGMTDAASVQEMAAEVFGASDVWDLGAITHTVNAGDLMAWLGY